MQKTRLSESDVCAKYITPALHQAGWDETTQIKAILAEALLR